MRIIEIQIKDTITNNTVVGEVTESQIREMAFKLDIDAIEVLVSALYTKLNRKNNETE